MVCLIPGACIIIKMLISTQLESFSKSNRMTTINWLFLESLDPFSGFERLQFWKIKCSPSSCRRSSTCDTPWSPPQSFASSSCPPSQSPVDARWKYTHLNTLAHTSVTIWVGHNSHNSNNIEVGLLSNRIPRFFQPVKLFFSKHVFYSPQASHGNQPQSPPVGWQTHTLDFSSSPDLNTAEATHTMHRDWLNQKCFFSTLLLHISIWFLFIVKLHSRIDQLDKMSSRGTHTEWTKLSRWHYSDGSYLSTVSAGP